MIQMVKLIGKESEIWVSWDWKRAKLVENSDKSELGVNLMYRMQNGENYAHSGDWIHNNGNE